MCAEANTDLVLLDLKSSDPHLLLGHRPRLAPTLRCAERLAALGKAVHLRFVLVPGLTDHPGNLGGVARTAAGLGNVERVDVLAYHRLGMSKYQQLGVTYRLPDTPVPTAGQMALARDRFAALGLTVT